MKRFFIDKKGLLFSGILLVILLLVFFVSVRLRLFSAETEKSRMYQDSLFRIGLAIDQNARNAWQMANVLSSWVSELPQDRHAHEVFLQKMLGTSLDSTIYGMGIWYKPGIFAGLESLYGPYVHIDLKDRKKTILTYEWNTSEYNYPEQPWYIELFNAPPGQIVNTEPYYDIDLNYISFGRSFERNGIRSGVISVDFVVPVLSTLISSYDLSQFESLQVYSRGGTVLFSSGTKDLADVLKSVSRSGIPEAVAESYRADGIKVECLVSSLEYLDWTVLGVIRTDSVLDSMGEQFRNEFLLVLALWFFVSLLTFFRLSYTHQRKLNKTLLSENTGLREEIRRRKKAELELELSQNELRTVNQHLNYLAFHDPVSGLPNTNALLEKISALREADASGMFVVMVSLENLRELSTVFDRDLIDFMIKDISERLLMNCDSVFEVYRGVGFVFNILVPRMERENLTAFLNRLVAEFRHPVTILNTLLRVHVSMGIADIASVSNPSEVLTRAASALVPTAETAGASYVFYSESHREHSNRRISIDAAMMNERFLGELSPVFQPVVDMKTSRVIGFETLVRWSNSDLGPVSPAEFIPLAEENGRIIELGWFIIEKALSFLSEMSSAVGDDWYLTVNVSPLQFLEHNFAANLEAMVDGQGIARNRLKIEITETGISLMQETFWNVTKVLIERGFMFAIDDFGTGQSSLSRLNSFHFEILKIDRSFVTDIMTNERNRKLVQSILNLSDSLGCRTIAEGIETEEQRNWLFAEGCFLAQGYFYYKPLRPEEAKSLLEKQKQARIDSN